MKKMAPAPSKWMALILGILAMPLGMLYVARAWWAILYLVLSYSCAIYLFWLASVRGESYEKYYIIIWIIYFACGLHAYHTASARKPEDVRPWYSRWYGLLAFPIALVIAIFGVRSFVYEPFRIQNASMEPSIEKGSYVVASKWGYGNYGTYGISIVRTAIFAPVRRGDILVFQYPLDPRISYVKRVIGVPGDTVGYGANTVIVNGVPIRSNLEYSAADHRAIEEVIGDVSWDTRVKKSMPIIDFDVKVPNGQYFVLGDNRAQSLDSRNWGLLQKNYIIGKVTYVFGAGKSELHRRGLEGY
ncbi:signal peptidase I [Burkholderia sp. Bp8963]|uniref:signal peptidase I n=1 Tax=Burkholderia sp. Bp8963 TaxID=2184547 RepID=UPI000F9F6966|nr:signal peptidase I [Burkholderia sp. Bp8963]RQS60659.1 signal peptidase I [Burkholderia sp. Bp8963]